MATFEVAFCVTGVVEIEADSASAAIVELLGKENGSAYRLATAQRVLAKATTTTTLLIGDFHEIEE